MRRLLFVLAAVIAILTFSCDTTQPDFDDSVPDVTNLTTSVSPEEGGTIEPSEGEFVEGQSIEIEAIPSPGWQFDRWEGDLVGGLNPTFLAMSRDRSVTAYFTETEIPLTILIEGQGTVLEEIIDQQLEDVALTVTSKTNDDAPNADNDTDEEIAKERDTITLQPDRRPQTNLQDRGDERRQLDDREQPQTGRDETEVREGPQQQQSRASKQKAATTTIKLTAEPDEGWEFARWEGDLTGSQNPDTVVVENETTITAVFEQQTTQQFTLDINVEGEGFVDAVPDRLEFNSGEEVTLTATPESGWNFLEWRGDLSGSENPETLVMDGNKEVTSVFVEEGSSSMEITQQPSNTTAGEFISPAPTVRITNSEGEVVEDVEVRATLNSETFSENSVTTVTTDDDGIASFGQLAVEAAGGNYRINFNTDFDGLSGLGSAQFSITPAAGDPSESSATVPDGVAGEPTPITINISDRFGNPVDGVSDDISVIVSGDNEASPEVTATDNAGEYTASYTPEASGEDEIGIELSGSAISGSPFTSSITATEVSSETSFAAISDAEVTVGEPVELTVTVRDDQDNPLTGLANEIVVSGLEDASAGDFTEGEPGVYTSEITSTVPADLSISVTVSGVSLDQVLALTFLTGPAETIEIVSGDNQSASVTTELGEPLVVRVSDALENPVAGAEVTFSFDDVPSGTSGQSIDPETAETDENGEASAIVQLGAAPGTYTVTATEADAGSVTFTAQADLGEATLISILNQPATIMAGEALDPAPAVEITDSEGNPVEGVEVNVALDGGSFTSGSTLQVATNSAGIAAFDNLVITGAGEDYTLTFDPGASTLDNITSDPFDVTAAAPDASNSTADVPNGSAGDPTTISVSLADEFGNPVSGSPDLISVEVSNGPNSGASFSDVQDEGDGTYQTTYTPQTIGTDQITITVDGSELEGSPFTSSVVTTDAEEVEMISQPGDAVAGTVIPGTPSVLVTDDNGNPVEDVEVSVSADGTSITGGTTTRSTGSSGEVEFDDLVIESAGSYRLQFDALGVSEAAVSEPFEITPADADQITGVGGNNQTGTVAQALANPFEVEVTDPFGNPVSGFEVEFSIDETPNGASGQSLNNETVTTNSSGRASSTLTLGDLVGEYTVAAGSAVGGVTFSAAATPGDADSFVFDEISSQTAGSSFLVRITAFDEFENVATGYSGSADLSTTAGTISPGSVNFDEGEASQSVSVTGAGTNQTITATDGSVSGTSNEFDVQTGGASDAEITQQPTNVTAGQAISPSPVVEVTDSQGNAVSGVDVEADLSSGSFASGAVSQTTDNNGLATFNNLSIETAGNFRILFDVLSSGVEDPESSEFTVNAADPDPQNTDASVPNGAAGEETEIIITVEDEFENRVDGVASDLSISVSGANSATPSAEPEGDGQYRAVYTPNNSGTDQVEITLEGTPISRSPYTSTVSTSDISSSESSVIADPETVQAGSSSDVTVQLRDGNGNSISGLSNSDFSISVSGNGSSGSVGETSDGTYQFTVSNNTAQQVTVSVNADGVTLDDTPEITFTAAEPDLIAIPSGSQPGTSVAGEVITNSPSVRVLDEFGNSVPNVNVTVSELDGQSFASGTEEQTTNNNGVAVFDDLVIEQAGEYRLLFTATGGLSTSSGSFEVEAAEPVAGNTTANVPNGSAGDQTTITITVQDAFGNRVEGVAGDLSVAVSGDNSGAETEPVSDDGNGEYSSAYTPQLTGTDQITIQLNGDDIQGSPFSSNVITSDADNVEINNQPETTTAGQPISGPPSVRVTDDLDNPVGDIEVIVSVNGPGSITGGTTSVNTNNGGNAEFDDLIIEAAGSYTLEFNAIGVSENAVSDPFDVVAGEASQISRESGNNQSATVTEQLSDPFVVQITDDFGNPVSGHTVQFEIDQAPTGATGQQLSGSSVETDQDGFAATTLTLGTIAGTYSVAVNAGSAGSTTFSATAVAGDAVTFSFDEITTPQTAGEPFGISITALDSEGNRARGYDGSASLSTTAGSVNPSTADFSNGTASLEVTLSSAGSDQTISAEDGSISGTSNTFDVQTGGVDASNSSVDADRVQLPAGESSELTIELRDGSGNLVSVQAGDISVNVTGSANAGSVSGSGGTYTAEVTNQTAETVDVTVSVNGVTLNDSPSIEFTPADADDLVLVSGNEQDADVTEQLSDDFVVRVDDGFDNPVPNVEVQFSISSTPSGASGQSLSSSSVETNSAGEASTRLTLGDTPGTYTVEAAVNGLGTVTFTADAEAGAPSQMTIVTQPENTRAGQPISPAPQVQITDNAGNPISGENVTVGEDGGYIFDGGTLTRSTNGDGVATFDDLVIESSGRYALVFDASASGVSNVTSDRFNVNPGVGDAEESTIEVPDGTAGEETEIKIRVEDDFGNAVDDAESNLSVTVTGDNSATPSVSKTAEAGEYAAIYTPLNSGEDRVEATLSGAELSNSPQFSSVSTSDVSAGESIVQAEPESLPVGDASTVTIELKDGAGNAISGLGESEFSIGVSGEGTADPVNETSVSGIYEFNVNNTTAEQVTVEVTVSGVTLNDTPQITFNAGDPDDISIEDQPGSTIAGQVIPGSPSVEVTDEFNNPVPGTGVTVTEQGGQQFASGTENVSTNSSGLAVFDNLVINDAGQYNLVFTVNGSVTVTSNVVNIDPAGADPASTAADVPNGAATSPTTITITVEDSFGNRVAGVADDLEVSIGGANSGAAVDQISDDGDGIYSTSYTPTSSGEDEITITLNGTGIAGSPYTSDVTTSEADNVEIETQPQQTVAGQPIAGPPAARVTDTGGNDVPGVEVTAGLQSGSFDSGTTTINTDGTGIAAYTDLVINIAGSYTMEFDAVGVSEDAVSQEFQVIAADADELSVNDGNNQTGTVTETLADPFIVEVSDAFGNTVQGVEIEFDITNTPAGASGQTLTNLVGETDENGVLSTELTLGNRPGDYEVTATADGLADVTFTATAEAGPAAAYEFETISSPQTAGQPFAISLTALDDQGNTAVSYGETVNLGASQGSVTPASAEFTNGTSSLDVSLDQAGSDITITATDGTISETSNAFDVQTGGVDAANSSVSVDPEELIAGETSQLTIELRDESNNPVGGLSNEDFSIDLTGAATASEVTETGTAGTYTADIDNQVAETIGVTVTANGTTLTDTPSIVFSAAEANAVVEISGNNQSGPVTQQLAEDFVVRVEDEFNNPVEGEAVTFAISDQPAGASGQSLSEESVTTDAEGLAATRLTLGDEPGTYTVGGTVSGLNTVSFNAEAQTGDASQMVVNTQPGETIAGEFIAPAPAVIITDNADNPIEGITVTVSEQGGYSFDSGSTSEVTNASGVAEFGNLVIQSADSYSLVFDADAAGIPNITSDAFDVVPASANPAGSTASVPDGVAGETTSITVEVVDEFNNPVTGEAGNLSVSVASGSNSGASFTSFTDNGDGTYSTSYTPENDGSDQIAVTLDGVEINGSPFTSEVSTGDVSASNSEVTADPASLQAGSSSLVSVDLRDASNNPISGLTSTDFSIDVTGDGSASTISESSTDGLYQFTVSNETAEEVTVTVTASGTTLQNTPEITFTAADPDLMLITTDPLQSVAGEPIEGPPAVTITDEFDNPVPNTEVNVTEQGGEPFGTGSTTSVNTNSQGVAAFNNLAIETVGQYNLVFSSAGVTNRTSNAFDVESAAPDAAQTTADVPNGSAGDQTNISITVRDEFGNRVEGVDGQITLEVQGDNAGATVASVTESGNGVYTTGYTPESTGTDQVVIEINGSEIQGSPFESSVDNSDAETITISQEPLETVAGNSIAGPPTVVVTDGFGNTVSGVEVTVSEQSGTDFDAGELTVSTDGSGIAEFSDLRIDAAGTYTLEFDAVGVATDAVSGIFEVIAADGDPAQTTAVIPEGGSNQPTTVTVTVRDPFGNTVEGAASDLDASVTDGPNVTELFSGFQDDGDGSYSASYTPVSSGTDEISITLAGSPISESPYTSEVSAGEATSLQVNQEPSETTAGESINPAPELVLTDEEGNGVSGVNITAILSSNEFTLGSTTTVSTNQDGVALFNDLVIETAETGYSITFDADAAGVSNATSGLFDVTAATASAINEVSGSGQAGEVTTTLSDPFLVEVSDAFGNPVEGETVEFSISNSPNGATGQSLSNASVQTDSEGLASTVLTLGTITGSYTTQAALGSETVSFSADATPGEAASYNFEEINSPQTAGTAFTITLQALDSEANVDTSYTGTATLSTTAGTVAPGTAEFTDGVATVSVTVTQAGTDQTITADDGSISATSNTFIVDPGPVSSSASSASSTSPHTANGADASTVTIELRDENGNVISGLAGSDFSVNAGENAVAGTVNETATNGTYEVSVTSDTAETVSVVITAAEVTLDDTPGIVFESESAP